jgi:hypothetical protein
MNGHVRSAPNQTSRGVMLACFSRAPAPRVSQRGSPVVVCPGGTLIAAEQGPLWPGRSYKTAARYFEAASQWIARLGNWGFGPALGTEGLKSGGGMGGVGGGGGKTPKRQCIYYYQYMPGRPVAHTVTKVLP